MIKKALDKTIAAVCFFGPPVAFVGILTACATAPKPVDCPPVPTPKSQVIDKSCDWATPILISKKDVLTDGTAKQILKHNETYTELCTKPKE